MFLSVKELELRKVRFDETLPPGQIDFSGWYVEASSPLRATGVAELLPHTDGEMRIQGRYTVEITAQCDAVPDRLEGSCAQLERHRGDGRPAEVRARLYRARPELARLICGWRIRWDERACEEI